MQLNCKDRLSLPPGPKNPLKILSYNLRFLKDPDRCMQDLYSEYGHAARIRLGPMSIVLLVGSEANRFLMAGGPDEMQAGAVWRTVLPFYKGSLLSTDGEVHDYQRKLFLNAFQQKRFPVYLSIILDAVKDIATTWPSHINLFEEMDRLALEIAARAFLGIRLGTQMDTILRWQHNMARMILTVPGYNVPFTARWYGNRAQKKMWAFLRTIVRKHLERPHNDALGLLIAGHLNSGNQKALSEDCLLVHAFTLLSAGHETTAALMTLAMAALLVRHDLMQQLLEEHYTLPTSSPPSTEQLFDLPFTARLLREVLRLYPPTPYITRRAVTDLVFDEYRIPEGTTLLGSIRLTHRLPTLFANPEQFEPSRFDAPRNEHKQPWALTAFGGGSHMCIGMDFALLEATAVLHSLVRHFCFQYSGTGNLPLVRFQPFVEPRDQIIVEIISRRPWSWNMVKNELR
jgi:cytochrome P450